MPISFIGIPLVYLHGDKVTDGYWRLCQRLGYATCPEQAPPNEVVPGMPISAPWEQISPPGSGWSSHGCPDP